MNYNNADFEAAAGLVSQLPASTLPEIVFSGRSNVGKSSLLNKILNRKALARVSATPGKTITINFYKAGDGRLVDLPGYGYAKRSKAELARFSDLCEGYFQQDRSVALVVQLVDMRHPATKDDMSMISFLCDCGLPFMVVLTKSDKLNKTERAQRLADFDNQFSEYENLTLIPFSSKTGEGVDDIKKIIDGCVEEFRQDEFSDDDDIIDDFIEGVKED